MAAHYCFSKWEKDDACPPAGRPPPSASPRDDTTAATAATTSASSAPTSRRTPSCCRRCSGARSFSTAYRAQKVVRLCVGCADRLRALCAALAKGEARAAGYFLDGTSDDDTGLRGLLWPLARDAAGASFAPSPSARARSTRCAGCVSASRRRRCRLDLPTLLRQKDRHGRTPLALAAADSHVAILRYLAVDRGAALADADAAHLRAILGALLRSRWPDAKPLPNLEAVMATADGAATADGRAPPPPSPPSPPPASPTAPSSPRRRRPTPIASRASATSFGRSSAAAKPARRQARRPPTRLATRGRRRRGRATRRALGHGAVGRCRARAAVCDDAARRAARDGGSRRRPRLRRRLMRSARRRTISPSTRPPSADRRRRQPPGRFPPPPAAAVHLIGAS